MKPLRPLSLRAETLVDQNGFMLSDPTDSSVLGVEPIPSAAKLVYALATNLQSGLTRRYAPAHPSGEDCVFGMDFSARIPLGVGIVGGGLQIFTNVVPPGDGTPDFEPFTTEVRGRALYTRLVGGNDGTDYRLLWIATDTLGNTYESTALLLCTASS